MLTIIQVSQREMKLVMSGKSYKGQMVKDLDVLPNFWYVNTHTNTHTHPW